jgi:hypothetical protein
MEKFENAAAIDAVRIFFPFMNAFGFLDAPFSFSLDEQGSGFARLPQGQRVSP